MIARGDFDMKATGKSMTLPEILRAIESLTEEERETLTILADKKLSEELLKRRKDVLTEMKRGKLLSEKDLLGKRGEDV
jgi:hypothetical protein